ncbi:MAG TPA: hypothetical protein VEN99_12165, partial [Acidimicrobiia bacterium]|nr:hypothetical protein [Acidimicrobiia bacterium]
NGAIKYQIADDPGQVSEATVTFDYQNGAPTAESGSDSLAASTPKDYHLVGHDPDGDPMTFWFDGADGPPGVDANPLVSIEPNGTLHFAGGPAGTWTIRFHVADPGGAQGAGTYTITTT